jgi:DNA-binding winged helix-turn-helix (wHTH) protein
VFSSFDLRERQLLKKGIRLKLQGQPFSILLAWLSQPGKIVTKEELRCMLWPRDVFIDFDHSLGTAINKLREVLDDSADNPRFVETLPRRGYRFIAPVEVIVDNDVGWLSKSRLPDPSLLPEFPDPELPIRLTLPPQHKEARRRRFLGRGPALLFFLHWRISWFGYFICATDHYPFDRLQCFR